MGLAKRKKTTRAAPRKVQNLSHQNGMTGKSYLVQSFIVSHKPLENSIIKIINQQTCTHMYIHGWKRTVIQKKIFVA